MPVIRIPIVEEYISQAKEPIEKSHNEPETRKKEKPNPQGQQADKEMMKVMATASINQAIRRLRFTS